ncbi:MAG: alpha/beta hydrolase [Pseudomonadota bacterium]
MTNHLPGCDERFVEVDGLRLRMVRGPEPAGVAPRSVLLLSGRTEFAEKYAETVGDLASMGFGVLTMDWRGQGASSRLLADPRRGHVDDFRSFQRDLDALLSIAAVEMPRPWFCVAHSMGCLVLMERLMADPSVVSRAVLVSPLFGLAASPPMRRVGAILARAARLIGLSDRYVPGHGEDPAAGENPVNNVLTSDRDRFLAYRALGRAVPERMLGGVTLGWLAAALDAMARIDRPGAMEGVTTPLLLFQAGNERVVSKGAIAAAAARLPVARLLTFPGAEHELLMERDVIRNRAFAEIDRFLG